MRDLILNAVGLLRPALVLKWAAFVMLAAILTLLVNREKLGEYFEVRDQIGDKHAEIAHLQTQLDECREETKGIENGDFELEREARERFNLIRREEKVLIVETPAPPQFGQRESPQKAQDTDLER